MSILVKTNDVRFQSIPYARIDRTYAGVYSGSTQGDGAKEWCFGFLEQEIITRLACRTTRELVVRACLKLFQFFRVFRKCTLAFRAVLWCMFGQDNVTVRSR
jgi:hypothetical protein